MKKRLYTLMLVGVLTVGGIGVMSPIFPLSDSHIVYAIDNFGNNDESSSEKDSTGVDVGSTVDEQDDVTDQLKGWKPIRNEDMQQARQSSQWLTDLIGVAISFILIFIFAVVGLITALDILYISFPPVRQFLYTAGTDGAGGMSGMNMSGNSSIGGRQWVSDEAVQVATMLGAGAQANGHGASPMPSYGMPGMPMAGAQSQQTQRGGGKVGIRVYIQKRITFLIFLGVASVLLFTSAFTDFGINVGGFILQLLALITEKLSSISF